MYDVTGAGDTVIATLGACLASGSSLAMACAIANRAAGIVVGKLGTSTVTPDELEEEIFAKNHGLKHSGVMSEDELVQEVQRLKQKGKRIVMTNGVMWITYNKPVL